MKLSGTTAFTILKDELARAQSDKRLLLGAMLVNIPFWGFIPYVTQALTVILLSFYLRRHLSSGNPGRGLSRGYASYVSTALIVGTMLFQLLWFPFISQIVTLVLLGILYAIGTPETPEKEASPL